MFHRGFHLGRLIVIGLFIFGAMTVARGMFRSGYQQGFVSGMAFSDEDGPSATTAMARPEIASWHRGGIGPVEGGFMGFGLVGLAFFAFLVLMVMGHFGRRHHWAHSKGRYGHGGWGHHRHWSTDGRPDHVDGVGPEKQPEEYL